MREKPMLEKVIKMEAKQAWPPWRALWSSMRAAQWSKNLLIFIPTLMSARWVESTLLLRSFKAFIAFCLIASAGYIFNDLTDLSSDRAHPRKRFRPLASRALSIRWALALMSGLAVSGLMISGELGSAFNIVAALYLISSFVYSLGAKRVILLDVFALAGLYTVRLVAGCEATGLLYSPWLLAFSFCLFLSLAFLKRYLELRRCELEGVPLKGRGYSPADIDLVRTFGSSTGIVSVLILGIYLRESVAGFSWGAGGAIVYLLCPLALLWICRLWVMSSRNTTSEDDPMIFAFKDHGTWVAATIAIVVLALAFGLEGMAGV
jgi:4-hydroxybenzoate polyprenyltransferase